MVRIMYGPPGTLGAGGAIISNRHVLTTAFVMSQQFTQITIWAGSSTRGLQTQHTIMGRLPHPAYQQNPRLNDIGIFRLNNDIIFTRMLQPIRLPNRMMPYESEQGTAIGFGGAPGASANNAG